MSRRARAKTPEVGVSDSPAIPDPFASTLLEWFDQSGRHDLPWLHPRTPYRVWLSEIMLQQTQVKTVIPYFQRFLEAFPKLADLASASLDAVLAQWSGLGYYARARNLHATARLCMEKHGGDLPRDLSALIALPGIGRSTAGAILAQAWGDPFPILDGNVKRVLSRYHGVEGWPGLPAIEKQLWALAENHVPGQRMADYTQAQMDLGATLCTRHDPACMLCPVQAACIALNTGRVEELPTSKPGKPLPERSALMLMAESPTGEVLLQRRPPTGIWASLWSLPEAADHEHARHWFEMHLHGDYDRAEAMAELPHTFSHYRLRMQPLRWRGLSARARMADNQDLRWVHRSDLASLGLPAPIRKLLETP